MKSLFLTTLYALFSAISYSQSQPKSLIQLTSDDTIQSSEIRDILNFEGIEYLKLNFTGKELASKTYKFTVKEIWDGKLKRESVIVDSKEAPFDQLKKVNDSVFKLTIISKLTTDNKLKMNFKFPRFSMMRKFNAIASDDYSLRNVAKTLGSEIKYGEKFYLLAYMLPYEKNGNKYWCAVESSGKDIENWGKAFGIKHYLVFEMLFE
ncbi:hypothetical protein [uncultured Kordia sp.]|uniref:hypothetical protein n=1 Tax=uncultured Kordia sp. TaxID=507699 RepID=UPI0026251B32|nr:hypothetical protein [uncultured Kordia sp.]